MDDPATIAVAPTQHRLGSLVRRAGQRIGIRVTELADGEGLATSIGALVCAVPSRGWDASIRRLLSGDRTVPHLLILTDPNRSQLPRLLRAPPFVREAICDAIWWSPAIEKDLIDALRRLVGSSAAIRGIARITDLVAAGDRDLRAIVNTILSDPSRHATLTSAIRDSGVPHKRALKCIRAAGFAPPSQFLWSVRALGAHALLRSGATVGESAKSMGYGRAGTMRRHFAAVFAIRPSSAGGLPLAELGTRLERVREKDSYGRASEDEG